MTSGQRRATGRDSGQLYLLRGNPTGESFIWQVNGIPAPWNHDSDSEFSHRRISATGGEVSLIHLILQGCHWMIHLWRVLSNLSWILNLFSEFWAGGSSPLKAFWASGENCPLLRVAHTSCTCMRHLITGIFRDENSEKLQLGEYINMNTYLKPITGLHSWL